MPGFIEWLPPGSGLLRLGPRCHAYGDEWDRSIVVAPYDPAVPTIEGAAASLKASHWRDALDVLHDAGIRQVRFERRHGSSVESHTVKTTRKERTRMDNITLLFGDIVAVNGDGKLAYIMGGPKYFGVGAEAHSKMQRIMANAISETTAIGEAAVAAGQAQAAATTK